MKALWQPLWAAYHMQAAAARVLPLPTSPCIRRSMGRPEHMSATASSTARRWAPVGRKGREEFAQADAVFV